MKYSARVQNKLQAKRKATDARNAVAGCQRSSAQAAETDAVWGSREQLGARQSRGHVHLSLSLSRRNATPTTTAAGPSMHQQLWRFCPHRFQRSIPEHVLKPHLVEGRPCTHGHQAAAQPLLVITAIASEGSGQTPSQKRTAGGVAGTAAAGAAVGGVPAIRPSASRRSKCRSTGTRDGRVLHKERTAKPGHSQTV